MDQWRTSHVEAVESLLPWQILLLLVFSIFTFAERLTVKLNSIQQNVILLNTFREPFSKILVLLNTLFSKNTFC